MKVDIGLLILRIGIGAMFINHGLPKLLAGQEMWATLGKAIGFFGIKTYPAFWGFMAAFSEFAGGIFLILGIFFTPACLFLFITMMVASTMHLSTGDGIKGASHAIEMGIVFLSLMITGPGEFTIKRLFIRG